MKYVYLTAAFTSLCVMIQCIILKEPISWWSSAIDNLVIALLAFRYGFEETNREW